MWRVRLSFLVTGGEDILLSKFAYKLTNLLETRRRIHFLIYHIDIFTHQMENAS
jgi:hypothetical protein